MDKCNFWKMGMKTDMVDRIKLARKDSNVLHRVISMVRRWIFKDSMAPEGKNVKTTKLSLFSMTPTRVRCLHAILETVDLTIHAVHFLGEVCILRSQRLRALCAQPHA